MVNKVILFLLGLFIFTGCSFKSPLMTQAYEVNASLNENEAAVVFMRPAAVGMAVQAPVAEYVDNNTMKFVGILSNSTKLLHITSSGEHEYLVTGERGGIVRVDFEAQKFYYVYIRPRMGVMKARFDFEPIEDPATSETLASQMRQSEWVENTDNGYIWFDENAENLKSQYYWAESNGKIQKLPPEAGTNTLIQ